MWRRKKRRSQKDGGEGWKQGKQLKSSFCRAGTPTVPQCHQTPSASTLEKNCLNEWKRIPSTTERRERERKDVCGAIRELHVKWLDFLSFVKEREKNEFPNSAAWRAVVRKQTSICRSRGIGVQSSGALARERTWFSSIRYLHSFVHCERWSNECFDRITSVGHNACCKCVFWNNWTATWPWWNWWTRWWWSCRRRWWLASIWSRGSPSSRTAWPDLISDTRWHNTSPSASKRAPFSITGEFFFLSLSFHFRRRLPHDSSGVIVFGGRIESGSSQKDFKVALDQPHFQCCYCLFRFPRVQQLIPIIIISDFFPPTSFFFRSTTTEIHHLLYALCV